MKQIDVEYIRADRSIEKYIHNGNYVFIYNDQGLYFDVFFSEEKKNAFFEDKIERGDLFFDNEKELDTFISFSFK